MYNENMLNNETTSMADKQATTSQNTTPASPQTQSNSGGGNYDPATQGNWEIMAKKMEDHDNRIADVEKDVDTNKLIMDLKDDVYELKDTVNKLALDTKDRFNKLALDTKDGLHKLDKKMDTQFATKDEMKTLKTELKDEMKTLKTELKEEMKTSKKELKDEMKILKIELKEEINSAIEKAFAKMEKRQYRFAAWLLLGIITILLGSAWGDDIIKWFLQ